MAVKFWEVSQPIDQTSYRCSLGSFNTWEICLWLPVPTNIMSRTFHKIFVFKKNHFSFTSNNASENDNMDNIYSSTAWVLKEYKRLGEN